MKNKGSVTLIVIAIALLIFGLIAVFAVTGFGVGQNLFNKGSEESVGPQVPSDVQVEDLNLQSTSDEIDAIENDINSTDLENLDSDLEDISQDLNSL